MNWQPFKERYERFKRWQREPMRYVQGEVEHRCNNCGFTVTIALHALSGQVWGASGGKASVRA